MNTRDGEQRSIRWGSNARAGGRVGNVVDEGGSALGRSQGSRCTGKVGGGLGGRGEQAALLVVAACETKDTTHGGGGRAEEQESPSEEPAKSSTSQALSPSLPTQ